MLRTGEAVRMFSFCLEPISINSVLGRLLIVASLYSTRLNDIHVFISVGKMRIIGIHSRIRV